MKKGIALVVYLVVIITLTTIGTGIQFASIGEVLPIWNIEYHAIDAYVSIVLAWTTTVVCTLIVHDELRLVLMKNKEETSE